MGIVRKAMTVAAFLTVSVAVDAAEVMYKIVEYNKQTAEFKIAACGTVPYPAGAPATGKLPTEPAPRAPERASAPKAQPAAPSAPWESEQVPYDDAMVGGFAISADGNPF